MFVYLSGILYCLRYRKEDHVVMFISKIDHDRPRRLHQHHGNQRPMPTDRREQETLLNLFPHSPVDDVSIGRILCIPRFFGYLRGRRGRV